MIGLKRLTFWKAKIRSDSDVSSLSSEQLLGYAILKNDYCAALKTKTSSRWHVFESVFRSYEDKHLYIPCKKKFALTVGSADSYSFEIVGPMYCEQNGLNKACAQVAIRSLLAVYLRREPSFSKIHQLAKAAYGRDFNPAGGLDTSQMRAVFKGLNVPYTDITYNSKQIREDLPFQKFLYSGIESGTGALLGFNFLKTGRPCKHVLPLMGHTFNRDQWVPHSDVAYFDLRDTRYLSSEAWVGSFIGHDDNFGANLTIPRFYLNPKNVEWIIELLPPGALHGGVIAEVIASFYLYSTLQELDTTASRWLSRLVQYANDREVVLRALPMTKKEYVTHLGALRDWKRRTEDRDVIEYINRYTPSQTWMVEISAPTLFSINQRKLGEILIDATYERFDRLDYQNFVFARFPSQFLFVHHMDKHKPVFSSISSSIMAHTPVYTD